MKKTVREYTNERRRESGKKNGNANIYTFLDHYVELCRKMHLNIEDVVVDLDHVDGAWDACYLN